MKIEIVGRETYTVRFDDNDFPMHRNLNIHGTNDDEYMKMAFDAAEEIGLGWVYNISQVSGKYNALSPNSLIEKMIASRLSFNHPEAATPLTMYADEYLKNANNGVKLTHEQACYYLAACYLYAMDPKYSKHVDLKSFDAGKMITEITHFTNGREELISPARFGALYLLKEFRTVDYATKISVVSKFGRDNIFSALKKMDRFMTISTSQHGAFMAYVLTFDTLEAAVDELGSLSRDVLDAMFN